MKPHCLHDAPSATYKECFCGKCGEYGFFEKMFSEECPSKKECVCKEVSYDLKEEIEGRKTITTAIFKNSEEERAKIDRLTAENKAQAERIEKLENVLRIANSMLNHIGCINPPEMHQEEQCQWCDEKRQIEQALQEGEKPCES